MILYYFPIAQNTGPVKQPIFRPSIMCDYYLTSLAVIMGTVSEINYFTTGSADSYFIAEA